MKRLALLGLISVSAFGAAFNFDISGGSGGGNIPDGTGSETSGGPLVISMTVSGNPGANITALQLAGGLELSHTFCGDLTLVLSHNGFSIDLMDRNYRTAINTFGSGLDLLATNSYLFDESALQFTGTTSVPSGTYGRFANAAAGSSSASGTYASLIGSPLDGLWTLTAQDWAGADTGALFGMRIIGTASAVPEPATLAVLGLGAAALLRRRKK